MFGNKIQRIERLAEKKKPGKLSKFLRDSDASVRIAAAKASGEIGGEQAFNDLILLLRDDNTEVRRAAAASLEKMKDSKARAHLNAALKAESDEETKKAISHALGALREEV